MLWMRGTVCIKKHSCKLLSIDRHIRWWENSDVVVIFKIWWVARKGVGDWVLVTWLMSQFKSYSVSKEAHQAGSPFCGAMDGSAIKW